MIKKKKLFKRPKKLFESFRIKEENELAKKIKSAKIIIYLLIQNVIMIVIVKVGIVEVMELVPP